MEPTLKDNCQGVIDELSAICNGQDSEISDLDAFMNFRLGKIYHVNDNPGEFMAVVKGAKIQEDLDAPRTEIIITKGTGRVVAYKGATQETVPLSKDLRRRVEDAFRRHEGMAQKWHNYNDIPKLIRLNEKTFQTLYPRFARDLNEFSFSRNGRKQEILEANCLAKIEEIRRAYHGEGQFKNLEEWCAAQQMTLFSHDGHRHLRNAMSYENHSRMEGTASLYGPTIIVKTVKKPGAEDRHGQPITPMTMAMDDASFERQVVVCGEWKSNENLYEALSTETKYQSAFLLEKEVADELVKVFKKRYDRENAKMELRECPSQPGWLMSKTSPGPGQNSLPPERTAQIPMQGEDEATIVSAYKAFAKDIEKVGGEIDVDKAIDYAKLYVQPQDERMLADHSKSFNERLLAISQGRDKEFGTLGKWVDHALKNGAVKDSGLGTTSLTLKSVALIGASIGSCHVKIEVGANETGAITTTCERNGWSGEAKMAKELTEGLKTALGLTSHGRALPPDQSQTQQHGQVQEEDTAQIAQDLPEGYEEDMEPEHSEPNKILLMPTTSDHGQPKGLGMAYQR